MLPGFPSCEDTYDIKTRALVDAASAQSSFSPVTRVKFKKISLIIFPLGTVIFHVDVLFVGKLLGKLGLQKYPLQPFRLTSDELPAVKERSPSVIGSLRKK